MLTSFKIDGITIPLIPSPLLGPANSKLFAADTMTLLVGPNGSGKTRTMMGLASILARKRISGKNSSGAFWDSEQDADSTCAIFYTSVPYHIVPPSNKERFRFIKTSLTRTDKPLNSEHKEIIKDLQSAFGLEARKIFTLPELDEYDFDRIMSQVIQTRKGVKDPWIKPFREASQQLNRDVRLPDGKLDWPQMDRLRAIRLKLGSQFAKELREKIGSEFALKVRAFNFASSGRAISPSAQKQLLELLGFSFELPSSKQATVPKKTYEVSLEKLRATAKILQDLQLTKKIYHINDEQNEELKAINLGKLGSLSLTQLSSGAATLIHQFASIDMACEELLREKKGTNLVLMIDEGDAFLHLEWQQRYIDYLDKTVARLKKQFLTVQVLIATHSPVLMSDLPRECIYLLDAKNWIDELMEDVVPTKPSESFGAPLDTVVRHVGQTGTMGRFSSRAIKSVVEEVIAGLPVSAERIEMIGDPIIRRQLTKTLYDRGSAET